MGFLEKALGKILGRKESESHVVRMGEPEETVLKRYPFMIAFDTKEVARDVIATGKPPNEIMHGYMLRRFSEQCGSRCVSLDVGMVQDGGLRPHEFLKKPFYFVSGFLTVQDGGQEGEVPLGNKPEYQCWATRYPATYDMFKVDQI